MPFSAGAASGDDDHERVEGVKDGKMQTGERQEVAGAALAEELACGSVNIGAIAERHGRKQGGGVPIEVRSVLRDEVRANNEETFAQRERDGELRALPIAGIAVGASTDVLPSQSSRTIGFAGIVCRTRRSDAGVQQKARTDVESRVRWSERREFLRRIGQRKVDETAGLRIGCNESAFHAPLSGIKSWRIGHYRVMHLRLSFVERRKARTIVMQEGDAEEKSGEIESDRL